LESKDTIFSTNPTLNLRGNLVELNPALVMGILNLTPDSFYDGGHYSTRSEIESRVEKMLAEGADILDLGGYSTRPGASEISEKEEMKRVLTGINFVVNKFPNAKISVDTFRSTVAEAAIKEGACMINDVSGGNLDHKMFNIVAKYNVPYVLMHMRGTPTTMKKLTEYEDLIGDIIKDLGKKVEKLESLNVKDIIIDPGFGFAKTIQQNFSLLKNLNLFKIFKLPILLGVSRKSMIYKTLGIPVESSLNGTSVLNTIGLMNGANILRVHDVKEAKELIKLHKAIYT